MVSELAKGDYEDLQAMGLKPTLEDFDRLNQLALRLTDGAETTIANYSRIGWAGDIPFYQPTCATFAWYLDYVDRTELDGATKDACWFFALAHARKLGAFDALDTPSKITVAVNNWLKALPITRDEMVRACRYAATGFNDAEPGKTDAQREREKARTAEDRRNDTRANVEASVTIASALTGIPPRELSMETPSRLAKMIEAVRANNPMGGGVVADKGHITADYQLAFHEIKKRLMKEKPDGVK